MIDRLRRMFGGASTTTISAAVQPADGGKLINTPRELELAIRHATQNSVSAEQAMRVAAVYACVRLRSSVPANMPLHLKRRVDDRTREDASDHRLWNVLRRRPNSFQTPSQFRRHMMTSVLLRGNAFAVPVRSPVSGQVIELLPIAADRVQIRRDDRTGAVLYHYTSPSGGLQVFRKDQIFHLMGLSLDGYRGVSPITFARNTIGLALAMEEHGYQTFRNGARPSNVLTHPGTLGPAGVENLRASLDAFRSGGDMEGKTLILEEGMSVANLSMTAEDAQWIESRKFSRSDIAMFFGVPPHMIGDTEKSTSWGSGIDSQTQGFVTFSAEDDLIMWEETIDRDLIGDDEPDLYARFNRAALVRGDLNARWEAHVKALQWGVVSPNEVRATEDMNPRDEGDRYYEPPNTAGNRAGEPTGDAAR